MSDVPFILRPGERVVLTAERLQYRGSAMISDTLGGATAPFGVGSFGSRTKTRKREGSALDAEKASAYLTSERIVIARNGWHKSGLLAEIPLADIRAAQASKTLTGVALDLAVPAAFGIDNLRLVFMNEPKLVPGAGARTEERDQWLSRIRT